MSETLRAVRDFSRRVLRGQAGYGRQRGTLETVLVLLITQRSQVQILPPLLLAQVSALFLLRKRASCCRLLTSC